jgi:hypothetical protein
MSQPQLDPVEIAAVAPRALAVVTATIAVGSSAPPADATEEFVMNVGDKSVHRERE